MKIAFGENNLANCNSPKFFTANVFTVQYMQWKPACTVNMIQCKELYIAYGQVD